MIVVWDPRAAQQQISARKLACPDCGHQHLRRHGYAAPRRIRRGQGVDQRITCARVRCLSCRATHVISPSWAVTRRGDAIEIIGAALTAKATGAGHRRIAADLHRPAATVRGWIRAATATATALYQHAAVQVVQFDPAGMHPWPRLCPTRLGEAIAELVHAAVAAADFLRVTDRTKAGMWSLIGLLTAGRLLTMPRPG